MDLVSKPKNILLVDDNYGVRFVLKKLIFKHFPSKKLGLNIYSASKGVEGLGLIFSVESDVIIIDTTLPKYNNLEIIEYLLNNDRVRKLNPKVIVLYYKNKPEGLKNYLLIDKSDIFFYKKVIDEISKRITPDAKEKFIFGEKLMRVLGELVINFSEHSTIAHRTVFEDKFRSRSARLVHFIKWCSDQLLLNFFLIFFYLVGGSNDPDTNVQQKREDTYHIKKRFYTTFTSTFLVVMFVGLTWFRPLSAATKTWDGGGTTNNWSDCVNWNGDTCPAAADTVIFDATSSKDVTVDAGFAGTIAVINLNSGYGGTMTVARSLSVTTFNQAAGTFIGGPQSLSFFAYNLSGGTFNSTSSTLTMQSSFLVTNTPTFNANGGNVIFTGSQSSVTISCNNAITFNLVTFTRNPGASTTTINNCVIPMGANPTMGINGSGSAFLNLTGTTLSGTGTLTVNTTALITLNTGSSLSGFSGLSTAGITVAGVTADFSSYSTFNLRSGNSSVTGGGVLTLPNLAVSVGALTVTSSTLTSTSSILSISGNMTISADSTFNANSGTVNFNGITSQTINCNNKTFNLASFNRAGSTGADVSNCVFSLGNDPALAINSSSALSLTLNNSTLNGTGTFNISSNASLILNAGSSISGFSGFTALGMSLGAGVSANFSSYSTFTLRSGNLTLAAGSSLTVPNVATLPVGAFSITDATFNSTSGILSVSGSFTIAGTSIYNANGGTLNFTSFSNQTISCNNASFPLVTFTKNGTPGTTLNNCSLPLGNNPTVALNDSSIGSMTMNNSTLSGTGTMTVTTNDLITMNAGSAITGFTSFVGRAITVAGATADFSAFSSMTLSDTLTLSSGSVSLPPTASAANVTISGGTFTSSSGSLSIATNLSISGTPVFNHNSGTVTFSGSTGSLTCNSVTFNAVSFAGQTGVKTINSGCNLPLGAAPTVPNGITLSGTLTGTGKITFSGGTQTINTTGVFSGFSGAAFSTLTVAGATLDLSSYSPLTILGVTTLNSGTLTIPAGFSFTSSYTMSGGTFTTVPGNLSFNALTVNAGVFNAPTGTLNSANTFNLAGGTFNHNNGTINFTGASQFITCTGAVFNFVSLANATGNPTINSGCNLPLGANPTLGGGFTLTGTLSGSGTLAAAGTASFGIGSSLSGFTGMTGVNLTVTNTGTNVNFGSFSPFDFTGAFSMPSGNPIFTAPSGTMNIGGSFTITSGTFNHNNGTVNFSGSGGINCGSNALNLATFTGQTGLRSIFGGCNTFPVGNNPVFPNSITVNTTGFTGTGIITNTTGTFTVQGSSTIPGFSGFIGNNLTISGTTVNMGSYSVLTVTGDFTLSGTAVFTAPSGIMSIGGNFIHTAGTFTHNSGSVVLNGGSQSISGIATTFNNLTKVLPSASPATLTFVSAVTETVAGTLTLNGFDTSNRLSLRSSSSPTKWQIDPQGTRNMLYLDVQDSNNLNAATVEMGGTGSNNSGNNLNWNFNSIAPSAPSNLGPTSVVNGTLISDTTPNLTFTLSDPNVLDQVRYTIQVSTISDFSTKVIDYTSGLIGQGSRTFTVGQSAGSGTYTTGNVGQALSSNSYYWRVLATDENGLSSAYSNANGGAVAFVLDNTPPNTFTITLNPPSPTNDTTPEISFSTTDNIAIDHYEVKVDSSSYTTRTSPYTLPTQTNGSHTVFVRAYDTAGNNTIVSLPFTIDTSSPLAFTPLLNVSSPTQNQTPTLTFSTTDPDGIDHYEVKIDAGAYTTQTSPYVIPSLDENVHSISVRAFDIAGNFTDGTLLNLTIDLTPPNSFTPTTLSGSTITNDQTPDIYFNTDDYNGVASYALKIDAGGFSTQSSPYTTPTLSEGDHVIIVRAFDNAGNFTDGSFVLTIDLTPPAAFTPIVTPTSPGTDPTPSVSFVTTDDIVMHHYDVKVDSGSFTTQASPYTLPTVSEGNHTITVRAFDTAGNFTDGSVDYKLDTGIPDAFTIHFSETSPTNNQTPNVTFSTTDVDGINRYEVKVDAGSFTTQVSPYTLPTLTEGVHTVTVRAFDNAGNFTDSSDSITIDLSGPSTFNVDLNINSPNLVQTPILTFNAADASGINRFEVRVDGGLFSTQTSPYSIPTLAEGAHVIYIRAYDNPGNFSEQTINQYTDLTDPQVVYDAPTLTSGGAITDTTITATDDYSILASGVNTSGGSSNCTQVNPTTVTCTTVVSASGDLHIFANDAAGNNVEVVSSGYQVDSTAPAIQITAPTKTSGVNITDTTVHVTDNYRIDNSDVISTGGSVNCLQTNVTTVDCTVTISASGTLHVTATDLAGNVSTLDETGYVISASTPDNFTPVLNTSSYTNNQTPQVSFTTNDADGINRYEVKVDAGAFSAHTSPYTLPTLSEGFHTITVRAYDNLGNFTDGSVSVTVDVTNPNTFTPFFTETSPTTETRPTVHFSTTDNIGMNHFEVKADNGVYIIENNPYRLPILSDGVHTIFVRAVDNAGNFTVGSADITIDTIAPNAFTPTLNVTSPTNNTTPALTFSTTDNIGVDHYQVKLDAGIFATHSSPYVLPTLTSGAHTITVRAFDGAGNTRDGSIVNLVVDNNPPAAFAISLNETSPSNNPTPQVTFATTDDDGINHYEIKADNTAFQTGTSPYTMPSLSTGFRTITVRAYDNAGNFTDSSTVITLDLTPPAVFSPTLNVTSPTQTQTPEVSFITTDNIGIDHYELQVDSNPYTTQTSPVTLSSLSEGSHNINVAAFDTAGNSRVGSVAIKVDLTGALINIITPNFFGNGVISSTTVSIVDNFGINAASVSSTGGTLSCTQTSVTRVDCTTAIVSSGDLTVNTVDLAGNLSSSTKSGYVIETTSPVITITAPTKNATLAITDTIVDVTDNYAINAADVHGTGGVLACTQVDVKTVNCMVTVNASGDLDISATDRAGNNSSKIESGYQVSSSVVPDPDAFTPVLNTDSFTTNTTPTVTFSTNSIDGINHYEVSLDNGVFTTQTSPYTLPERSEGFHTVTVRAISNTFKFTDGVVSFTVDLTAPTDVEVTVNVKTPTNNNRPTVTFAAQDNFGIDHYEVKVESSGGVFTTQTSPYVTDLLEDGKHTITVKALDKSGNSTEAAKSFSIDSVPPTGAIVINNNALDTEIKKVNLALSADDDSSGVEDMIVSESKDFKNANVEPYSENKEWILSDGGELKRIYVKFIDKAGNESLVYSSSINYIAPPVDIPVSEETGPKEPSVTQVLPNAVLPSVLVVTSVLVGAASAVTYPSIFIYGVFFIKNKRKFKKFGIVYDVESKAPIPFALVRIFDASTGKLMSEIPTDLNGKYGFVVDAGKYRLTAESPDFVKYEDTIDLDKEGNFGKDIPLSKTVNSGSVLSSIRKRLYTINRIVVYAGFVISLVAFIITSTLLNGIILGLYILQAVVLFIFERKVNREWGYVFKEDNKRIKGAFVRIYDSNAKQLEVAITDAKGRYYFNLKDGNYLVSADGEGLKLDLHNVDKENIYTTQTGNKFIKQTVEKGKPINLKIRLTNI